MCTVETTGIKSCVVYKHSPTPDENLSGCCHKCQFLCFTATHQAFVEVAEGTISSNTAKSTHKQATSEWTVTLARDACSLANTGTTFMWLGIQSSVCNKAFHAFPHVTITRCQSQPTVHHHQDMKHILLSHTRHCEKEFALLFQMPMGFQVFSDSLLYLKYMTFL